MRRLTSRGFTIIELMISVSALSVLLLLAAIGIIQISQAYYKGIINASTQQTVRTITDSLSQTVQYTGASYISVAPDQVVTVGASSYTVRTICVDSLRYSYALDYQQVSNGPQLSQKELKHGLWQDIITDPARCSGVNLHVDNPSTSPIVAGNNGTEGRELLGERMRLMGLLIEKCSGVTATPALTPCSPDSSENLYRIRVNVMYGASDLINYAAYSSTNPSTWKDVQCKSRIAVIGVAFCAKADLETIVGKRLR